MPRGRMAVLRSAIELAMPLCRGGARFEHAARHRPACRQALCVACLLAFLPPGLRATDFGGPPRLGAGVVQQSTGIAVG
eukprot:CAMPEP_0171235102 /NCGR_PEP_ID=MMETSP0790-20130122/41775_1 /TAXON_ID=2925 /ORGANISM="Alexandrium catenella, Strain OF101" /LENGTH=78 /DNA_ID=CAMNT_0011701407 /DNA_START=72 /DNA_END=308 /DNA_ORIENTATION=+